MKNAGHEKQQHGKCEPSVCNPQCITGEFLLEEKIEFTVFKFDIA